jgi:hypothetical protein
MGKRQTRIFAKDIPMKLLDVQNKEVNILLKNGTVFHGIIKHTAGSAIHLTDMLGRKHIVNISMIAEKILDMETLY